MIRKDINFQKIINLLNEIINHLYFLKQEAELLIPAQTGNRTIVMYTSIERILSVDLKRKDIQLIIDFDLYINWLNVGVRLENVPKISVK